MRCKVIRMSLRLFWFVGDFFFFCPCQDEVKKSDDERATPPDPFENFPLPFINDHYLSSLERRVSPIIYIMNGSQ